MSLGEKRKTLVLFVSLRSEIRTEVGFFMFFFIRRNLFLVDSDVKRIHVSFNMQESKLFITRSISRL